MAFIILYPLVYMLSLSIREGRDVYDMSVVWIPKHYTLDNFKTVFGPLNFAEVMKNSGILAVTCTVLSVFVCSLAGYGFARFQFRENRLLFLVVILTILIPPQLTGLPNYVLFSSFDFFGLFRAITGHATNLNLLNNMGVMMLMAALGQGLRAGLFIFIFRQYYKGVPNELEQAAVSTAAAIRRPTSASCCRTRAGPSVFVRCSRWYGTGAITTRFPPTCPMCGSFPACWATCAARCNTFWRGRLDPIKHHD